MMERGLLPSIKFKLKLVQPPIMCSGRERVECYYRGKLVRETPKSYIIEIKSYGKIEEIKIDKVSLQCKTEGFENLQVLEIK